MTKPEIRVDGDTVTMPKQELQKILSSWNETSVLMDSTHGCSVKVRDDIMLKVRKYYRKLELILKK